MRPQAGGRLLLRLVRVTEDEAVYATTVSTEQAEWVGLSHVRPADGHISVEMKGATSEVPSWLSDAVRAALRVAWRVAVRPGGAFPKRIQRWRAGPAPGGG